eukprot:TRINITY_DN27446_c0_g1_i1.p1 TRINITY_DN27446_c0_g1~~TRINITY_DN27446_c0_g1_i1.p1  ORF type:complete len:377 (-),score=41.48 TRINITY_DN27446_c0_g1_i1:82-1212(-)
MRRCPGSVVWWRHAVARPGGANASSSGSCVTASHLPHLASIWSRCGSTHVTETSSAWEKIAPPSISVHKGWKIQASLCVERPPLRMLDPEFAVRWREFRKTWEERTGNAISLSDELVYMRLYFHFLEARGAPRAITNTLPLIGGGPRGASSIGRGKSASGGVRGRGKAGGETSSRSTALALGAPGDLALDSGVNGDGTLSSLLSGEGLDLAFPERGGRRKVKERKVEKRQEKVAGDTNLRSLERLQNRSLYLLVRYATGKRWTFPKADRPHGQSMRDTLMKMSGRQLGSRFEPFIVGACPFGFSKLRSQGFAGVSGRKVFYYRGRVVPGSSIELPNDSDVKDWIWSSRDELPSYLGDVEWQVVRDGLPLDDVTFGT